MNRTRARWLGPVLCGTLFLSGCFGHQRLKVGPTAGGEVVEAEGLVPYVEKDLPGTQKAALAEAQKSAVEKAVGVLISGKTRVEKSMLVESRILANTSGYISKYDILREGRDGEYYKTRIRALVLMQKVEDDVDSLGLRESPAENPRLAILLEESTDGQVASGTDATQAVTAVLLQKGYAGVDRAALAGAATQKILDAVKRGDTRGISDLGGQIDAEVFVTGQAQATEIKVDNNLLGGMSSYRARVTVQAMQSGTGQVLAAQTEEASGLNVNRPLASAKALQEAGRLAGEKLGVEIRKALRAQGVDIRLHGVNLDQIKAVQTKLSAEPSVKSVVLRDYTGGEAKLSAWGKDVTGNKLAEVLSRDGQWQVSAVSASYVDVSLRAAP